MNIACIIQRYGTEVIGGGETFVRLLAEHLVQEHKIEVLTTCAGEYQTWSPAFPAGISVLNGVSVRRFPVDHKRDEDKLTLLQEKVFFLNHTEEEEIEWAIENGPYSPEMIRFIRDHQDNYDLILFFTFRYFHSYAGIPASPSKAVLIPFAEDEPALYLNITKSLFSMIRGVICVTIEEELLIRGALGCRQFPYPSEIMSIGINFPPVLSKRNQRLKPYIFYLGRIDPSKGCNELFSFYIRLKKENANVPDLLLAGSNIMPIPNHPSITYLGKISELQKYEILRNADFLIMPSPYESLSIVTLEAMAQGTPVLVNASCNVLIGHCIRSNGGLWYDTYDEFVRAVDLLTNFPDIRDRLGKNGYNYICNRYNWNDIMRKYSNFFHSLI